MKSRLAASVKLLSAGKCWMNTHNTVSSRSIFTAFDLRSLRIDCSSKARCFESFNRAVHSVVLEDDVFSELGPEESECSTLVTEKVDDFVDDEEGLGILEGCAKKIKLVTEKYDDFSDDALFELGPGISECNAKLKLVTEKREPFLKTQTKGKESASNPLVSGYKPNAKDLFAAIKRTSTTSLTKSNAPVLGPKANKLYGAMGQHSTSSSTDLRSPSSTDHKELSSRLLFSESNTNDLSGSTTKASPAKLSSPIHALTSTHDTKREVEYSRSVSINNVPLKVGLAELIEAISVFGEVSGASTMLNSDKSRSCSIEFEDADSRRRAILDGKIEVGSNVFSVKSCGSVDLVAVRINNINENTPDSEIHSICKSIGELAGLRRTSKNVVDAFFYVQNDRGHCSIVKKLNKTVLDLNCWSAQALETSPNSSEVSSDKDVRCLQRQILNQFSQLKRELILKELDLQDLEYLTMSILHIRE